jgi:uncharacterized protein (DUF1697 family)
MRYAAFLRAINVGRTNRVLMTDLRDACERAGFQRVVTYLQSGNLVFDADGPESAVAAQLEGAIGKLGLRQAHPVVRDHSELATLVHLRPFAGYDGERFRYYVTLFREPLPDGVASFLSGRGFEITGAREREVFWVVEAGHERGIDVNGLLEKRLRMPGTTRYWHVVEAVAGMTGSPEEDPVRGG